MHLFISFMLCDLSNLFFVEKYFLNKHSYQEITPLTPYRLYGHFIFYIIVFCFLHQYNF